MTKHTRDWLHSRRRIAPSYGRILLIGAIAVTVLNAAAVSAQEAVVEEIIVTATKRGNVSVQEIRGGIRAVSGETIDD